MTAPVTYPGVTVLPGLDIKVIWRPKALNFAPQQHASGREVIVGAAQYPMHEFELQYNGLRNYPTIVEFQTLMGFFLQLAGTLNGFLFSNPYDNQVTGSQIATGDGATTKFILTRTYGAGGYTAAEPIGYLNTILPAVFNVYVNGVLKTLGTDYTLDQTFPGKQTITFTTAPPATQPVSIDASYWYFCRFSDDALDFEQLVYNIFQIKKVMLLSKRGPF
jgi:uncharacterized protein (TIGR02217 family)